MHMPQPPQTAADLKLGFHFLYTACIHIKTSKSLPVKMPSASKTSEMAYRLCCVSVIYQENLHMTHADKAPRQFP